jgi:prepilin-type N-terminal cleavage/methylation domain-containing protein
MKIRTRRFSNNGFSMLELMIVMVGAVIIASMALPSMNQRSNHNVAFAAQEIRTQMQFAKLKAISGNEPYRVNFLNANAYQVELSDGTVLRGPYALPSGTHFYTSGGSQAVTFPGNYVLFQPDGNIPVSGNGSAGRIKLVSNDGLRADVLVNRGGIIRHTPPYTGSTPPF